MVDPVVQRLIEHVIDSPVKLHLLLIFHENPRMEATALAIADRVCRDIWSIAQALEELAADGVMAVAATMHGDPVYRYAPLAEREEPIRRLLKHYNDPMERDMLQRTIRNMEPYALYRRAPAWEVQVA